MHPTKFTVIAAVSLVALVAIEAQAQADDWSEQMTKAATACSVLFKQMFQNTKGKDFAQCMEDQTRREIKDCFERNDMPSCVQGRSLRVLQICDLRRC